MSRAEKKLAELKAKAELAKLKAEKHEKQQQDWEETKQKWANMPIGTKRIIKIIGITFGVIILISAFSPRDNQGHTNANDTPQEMEASQSTETKKAGTAEKTPKEKLLAAIVNLISSKQAFDAGSYVKGDIPQGEYAFIPVDNSGKYYSEEDEAGNIIDNENFSSFGYVYVNAAGDVTTRGVLIPIDKLKDLGVTGAKDVYEKLNDTSDYMGSGMYKVGMDIPAGQYIIQSQGSAYVAVLTGPVGNNDIVDNDNFNGKHTVNIQDGQYLSVSRGEVVQ